MAGDWIKMKCSLVSDPKVMAIGRELEQHPQFAECVTGSSNVTVTLLSDVTLRYAVTGALHSVWCAANEHAENGRICRAGLSWIDAITGFQGFGVAMQNVGWAIVDGNDLILPKFDSLNTSSAERQKRYREKHRVKSDVTRNVTDNVTRDVTSNAREEKRREDSNTPIVPKSRKAKASKPDGYSPEFERFWNVFPSLRKTKKAATWKAWQAAVLRDHPETIITAAAEFADTPMAKGEFCPGPEPWLNNARWDDDRAAWQVGDGKTKAPVSRLMTQEEYDNWTPYGDAST